MTLAADPVRDAEYRSAALQVAEILRDRMMNIALSQNAMDSIANHGMVTSRISIGFPEKLGIPPTEFLMNLQGASSRDRSTAYFDARNMIVGLRLLPTDAQEAAKTRSGRRILQKFLISTFNKDRDIIVHEIIHMLDYLRGNITLSTTEARYARVPKEQFRVLYVNSPEEFNALFQQGIVQITDLLNRFPKSSQRNILSSFDKFMEFTKKTSTLVAMRRALLPKFERKLDVRLWQTWNYLRENMP